MWGHLQLAGIMEANGCICFQKNFWEVQALTAVCLWLHCTRKKAWKPSWKPGWICSRKEKQKWVKAKVGCSPGESWVALLCRRAENRRGGCAAAKVLLSVLKMGNHTGTHRASGETTCCFSISSPAPRNPPNPMGSPEAPKWWIISSSAPNLLCSTGQILPSWWGLLLNHSTS